MTIHIDIGGEGRYPGAINVNPVAVTSTTPPRPIPNLLLARGEALPLGTGTADVVTVEHAPIRPNMADEIARVLKPGGTVRLLHPADYALSGAHDAVAGALGLELAERATSVGDGIASTILRRAVGLLR